MSTSLEYSLVEPMADPFGLGENGGPVITRSEEIRATAAGFVAGRSPTGIGLNEVKSFLRSFPEGVERDTAAQAILALGVNANLVDIALDALATPRWYRSPVTYTILSVLSTASFAACVFHGYRRNNSVGWAIGWGVLGALFPVITPTIAVAQGFAKPKK